MESKNRNLWIILAAIGVMVVCCCILAVAAAAVVWTANQPPDWFTSQPSDWSGATSLQSERSEETFDVGDAPTLEIDSFAGNVTVRAGESGVIRVVATKKARSRDDLDRIEVEVSERDGRLVIRTEKPPALNVFNNAAVNLEITAPDGTRLDVLTGAGNADIDGITGEIDADTGAGNVDVRGAAGSAHLDTGAGNIRYQGTPQGECRFETGAGNITLLLPADPNVQVNLETGTGNVEVDFVVDGQVTRREVQGAIGSGTKGAIYAQTGAGNIDVVRR